jgi:hypothetical protein
VAGIPITKKESELLALYQETCVDFSELPSIMTAQQVASLLGMTVDALSQDRVGGNPIIPYVKLGRRVRYLRSDVILFLFANRIGETEALRCLTEAAALRRKVAKHVVRDTEAKLAALKRAGRADEP